MPEFILFGDSLTEWSFSEDTQGFGRFLQERYRYKVGIVNEGTVKCVFLTIFVCFFFAGLT